MLSAGICSEWCSYMYIQDLHVLAQLQIITNERFKKLGRNTICNVIALSVACRGATLCVKWASLVLPAVL